MDQVKKQLKNDWLGEPREDCEETKNTIAELKWTLESGMRISNRQKLVENSSENLAVKM